MDVLFEIDTDNNFEIGVKQLINNLSYSSLKLDNNVLQHHELKRAEDELRKLIFNSNFDIGKVSEMLNDKNWDEARINLFANMLNKDKPNILYGSLNHHLCGYGETVIQSDWIVKLVLGTCELNTLKYPLLQLILSTVNIQSGHCKNMYELDKGMLLKSIKMLETHLV